MREYWYILLLLFSNHLLASDNPGSKRIFTTSKISNEAPVINGHLDDSVWNKCSWQENFIQQIPSEGAQATQKTKVNITYDHDNIYVGIFCYDNPEDIRRIFTRRDEFEGDVVGFALDSYFNQRTAFEFMLTAAGQKIDLIHSGSGNTDRNWNSNWEGATAISDSGWSAEFRIPFSQLRYSDKENHTWGLHIWRWIDRNKERNHWNLIPINAAQGVHNFGELHGISNIRTSRQAELLPYVSTKLQRDGGNSNPYISDYSVVPNAGIDAKLGISSNFTLDLTVNPDFGQIEADPSELNLSAYETFFQEKRPFFLEGRDIFDFMYEGNRLFYSRRVGSAPRHTTDSLGDDDFYVAPENTTILASGKLSGRTAKGWSVGIIQTVTGNEYGKVYTPNNNPGQGESDHHSGKALAEPLTNYFASRVKKQSATANTIVGGAFNSVIRDLSNPELKNKLVQRAHTAGMDFQQFFNNKNYFVQAFGVVSHLEGSKNAIARKQNSHIHRFQRQDATHLAIDSTRNSLTGSSGFIRFRKQGGNLNFGVSSGFWSPQLNINDIGFIRETDYHEHEAYLRYQDNEPKKNIRSYSLMLYNSNRWTYGNEHIRTNFHSNFSTTFHNLWEFEIGWEQVFPALDARVLRGGPALYQEGYQGGNLEIESNSAKRLYFETYFSYYSNIGNESYHMGYGGEFNWNPLNQLKFSLDINYGKNNFAYEFFDVGLSDINVYMIGRLHQQTLSTTIRAEYYITPEISLQYYGNPYFSAVKYSQIKRVQDSKAENASQRFYDYMGGSELAFNEEENTYYVNESNGASYDFLNPDVSFGEFNQNFVFRWEYKLGSVFYVVYSHNQNEYDNVHSPHLNAPVRKLFQAPAGNVLMFKLSYWFNV